jgi:outer membrane protein assembly complex protein YaeT
MGTDPAEWQGAGAIREAKAVVRGVEIASEAPGGWSFEGGRLSLPDLRWARGKTRVSFEAEATPLAVPLSFRARATGRIDHEIARSFIEDLGLDFTGTTDFQVSAEKRGAEPLALAGRGVFSEARLVMRDPPVAFTNLSGEVVLDGDRISLARLSADAGGGKVEAEGSLGLEGAALGEIALRARARSIRLDYPEGLRSELSGEVRLRGAGERLRLTGDIDLTRALLSRDISIESELLQSLSRASAASAPGLLASRIDLDLRVRAPQAFRVDNNLARMEASVNLTVSGTLAAPELGGIASARPGGRFRFGGNEYRVETGRILLRGYPSTPPELDIVARTSIGEYDIRLALRGPTDNLATQLSSESHPDLSRGDVASLLLTGRTLSESSDSSRDIVSRRMVSYLGATLADLAVLGIGEALPFEILTAEPALIAGEADPGARFTLGARFENALSLVYSIGLDNAEDQIWVIDYELPRRLRTQVVRDQENEYALGVSQEVRFDVRDRKRPTVSRPVIAEVSVAYEGDEELEELVRRRLAMKPGASFDYWKAWGRAEEVRRELRSRGFLEALVDVIAEPRPEGGIRVEYRARVGPRVRFEFPADEPDGSLEEALLNAWTGEASDLFLTTDLTSLATGTLFEDGYFTATAEIATERSDREVVVKVFLERGSRGGKVAVDFDGNNDVADSYLLDALPKTRSREFHDLLTGKRSQLSQRLSLRYASLGYVRAVIGAPVAAFDEKRGEYRVKIPVTEGRRALVRKVTIEGASPADEPEIQSKLSLRAGEPFAVDRFARDRTTVAAFYRERGFPEVAVEASVEGGNDSPDLDVRFQVRPGAQVVVAGIEVRGNEATRESVIRREIRLEPGTPLSSEALGETERGLYDLGIFQSAEVVVEEPGEPSGGPLETSFRGVQVRVVETQDLELDYGGRGSTDGFFEAVTELRAPNVFGSAQHASFRALVGSERRIFRFSYHSPYLARYRLKSDFFVERGVEHQGEAPFDFTDRTWTFTAQQTRPVAEAIDAQWSYTLKRIVSEFASDFDSVSNNRGIVTGSLIGDHRDNLIHPRRGSLWLLTGQVAPRFLGSDLRYTKFLGQLYLYVPLRSGVVWASGVRFGAANSFGEPLRLEDGFRAGGPNSVRGFPQNSLGPRDPILGTTAGGGLLIVNQEIRFPLWWRLRGAGFYDAGNAFESASDIHIEELRQNVGAGLRLDLPFGVLRLDWAAVLNPRPDEKPWQLLFSLGEAF